MPLIINSTSYLTMNKILNGLLIMVASIILSLPGHASKLIREEGIPAEAPLDEYSGSKNCASCHQEIYDNWKNRVKSSFVRYRESMKGSLPIDWQNSPIQEKEIFLVVGKRRKMAFIDNNWKVIPYEYKLKTGKWEKRDGWAKHSYDYRARCASCHTVALDTVTLNFKELNVGCEACHGPGRKHIEGLTKENIIVPGNNTNLLDTCRKCHNSRKNHARELENFKGPFHK